MTLRELHNGGLFINIFSSSQMLCMKLYDSDKKNVTFCREYKMYSTNVKSHHSTLVIKKVCI